MPNARNRVRGHFPLHVDPQNFSSKHASLTKSFFGGTRHLIRIVIIVSDEVHGRRQELLEGYFNCPFLASQYISFILSLSFFLSLLFPSAPLRRSRPLLNQLGSLGSAVSSVGGVRD